jgi:hypothetical protein
MALGRAQSDNGVESESVAVPRRGTGARRPVWRRKRLAVNLHMTTKVALKPRDRLEQNRVSNSGRVTRERQIRIGRRNRDGTNSV